MTKQEQIINRAVGRRIQEMRLQQGMTRNALAQKAKLHHAVIGYTEKAEKGIMVSTLIKIIIALDISMDQFWKGLGT